MDPTAIQRQYQGKKWFGIMSGIFLGRRAMPIQLSFNWPSIRLLNKQDAVVLQTLFDLSDTTVEYGTM